MVFKYKKEIKNAVKTMELETYKLKDHPLNKELFDDINPAGFNSLKTDIQNNGIKTELHVLPDYTILAGHQRFKAAKELQLEKVPVKILTNLTTPEAVETYIITDNLLRRHLSVEQRAPLEYRLYKIKTKGWGGDRRSMSQVATLKEEGQDVTFDVYKELAAQVGQNRATIARHIEYAKAIEARPELKGKKINQVKLIIKKEKQMEKIKTIKPIEGKFNLIVCDPPWEAAGEHDPNGFRGGANYPIMNYEQLKTDNIKNNADDDCILWLWAIDRSLDEALQLIKDWGFERKATLIWHKLGNIGLGNWLRVQHEYCFLCVKGEPIFHGENFKSVFEAPRHGHSEKPEEFYTMIEAASPYTAKLDYFARKKREGWTSYGDEV